MIAIEVCWVFDPIGDRQVAPRLFRIIIDGNRPIVIEERVLDRLKQDAWMEVQDTDADDVRSPVTRLFPREMIIKAALRCLARQVAAGKYGKYDDDQEGVAHITVGSVRGKDMAEL